MTSSLRSRPSDPLASALLVLLLAPTAGAVAVDWDAHHAIALVDAVLAIPEVRAKAVARGPFGILLLPTDAPPRALVHDGATREGSSGSPYIVRLTSDAALAAINADDPLHVLRCLVAEGHVVVEPSAGAERLGFRAARSHAADGLDCHPRIGVPLGDAAWLGDIDGSERLVVDRFGTALGWQDPEAPSRLGRAAAGVSRLSAAERAAAVDGQYPLIDDPWLAGNLVASLMHEARGLACVVDCAPSAPTLARQDALRTDPRVGGGPS